MDLIDKYLYEGDKIYGKEEYILIVKSGSRKGQFVGMGNFPSSHKIAKKEDDARVFTGNELLNMGYDWQMNYKAKKQPWN